MKRTKDELIEVVKKVIGDRADDEALGLIEDVSDSFVTDGETEWKQKFDEMNEKYNGMVQKYKDRFGSTKADVSQDAKNKETINKEETPFGGGTLEDVFEGGL